jgi:C-terminal processing protease CtpA/Prc
VHADVRISNLHAFARLYGVVRWFHPSDAAATIDWDQFAIDGTRRVIEAPDRAALRAQLTALFAPIAPTVHLAGPGEVFPREPALHPDATDDLEVVAWQHEGFGDSTAASGYLSKRRHRRATTVDSGPWFGAVSQSVDAAPYRNHRVRLRGKLRAADHGQARMWMRIDRENGPHSFFDNMRSRLVGVNEWTPVEIIGNVEPDATRILFGAFMASGGQTWYDDFELAVEQDGAWAPIALADPGFESAEPLTSWHAGVSAEAGRSLASWELVADHDHPAGGEAALRITPKRKEVTDELFAATPAAGETVDVELVDGLRARVPIALYSRDGHTIGDDPAAALRAQATPAPPAGFDATAGIADVIVLWNTLDHFWPYWNTVHNDWPVALDRALADALDDRSVEDHVATLAHLAVAAPDDHSRISCPGQADPGYPPFAVDEIEGRFVITASEVEAIERGDELIAIDGQPAPAALAASAAVISGSPQWRKARALRNIAPGPIGAAIRVELRRAGALHTAQVTRADHITTERPVHAALERFADGVYYIDLAGVSMDDLDRVMSELAIAPGIVFDVRGYPRGNDQVLSHLVTHAEIANHWESIPELIRPETSATPAAWNETSSWNMPQLQVLAPHLAGRIAFLTGPGAVSYAETVMELIEHFKLGAIVGAPTAGTNGDVAQVTEPTGCTTYFTGRRVTQIGGARQHLLGVQPTIPAARTLAGMRAGRDDVIERGLRYVRTGS